ncbi:MoaD/ThiS family protein [Leucobacter sp. GX24907]
MAQLTVRYFAAAAEAAGRAEEFWDLGAAPTLEDLRHRLSERYGAAMDRVLRTGSFLVDGVVRRDGGTVCDGAHSDSSAGQCTVDVLPPFAGG